MALTVPRGPIHDRAERLRRLTGAFVDDHLATTADLERLLHRLYLHDEEALAHAQRVALTAHAIGGEMGLPEDDLHELRRAALVHDIGRLASTIEPGQPAGDQFGDALQVQRVEQVKAACEVLSAVPFLESLVDAVGATLEHFDGSGHPHGLSGYDIPLAARILAVADAADALTSMCLALEWSVDVAAGELVRRAGARFDPDVVSAWLHACHAPPVPGASHGGPGHWLH